MSEPAVIMSLDSDESADSSTPGAHVRPHASRAKKFKSPKSPKKKKKKKAAGRGWCARMFLAGCYCVAAAGAWALCVTLWYRQASTSFGSGDAAQSIAALTALPAGFCAMLEADSAGIVNRVSRVGYSACLFLCLLPAGMRSPMLPRVYALGLLGVCLMCIKFLVMREWTGRRSAPHWLPPYASAYNNLLATGVFMLYVSETAT